MKTLNRRSFLQLSLATAASLALAPRLNALEPGFKVEGKEGLFYHNDRPVTGETPAHLLNDEFTPKKYAFIRNNGRMPDFDEETLSNWTLKISGEACGKPVELSLDELKAKFKHYTYSLVIECGGNGRAEIVPATPGTKWGVGAVYCGRWKGVRLKDLLDFCEVGANAVYVGYVGADLPLDGDVEKKAISRGIPIAKAMSEETLIAWEYEGEPISMPHGAPLRLVAGGFPGSVSGKWLTELLIRDKVHDGEKMKNGSYMVPKDPIAPGFKDKVESVIIESMPVKSLITRPKSGIALKAGEALEVLGHAWAGELAVKEVFISIDYGASWVKTKLQKPHNRLAWQTFSASISLPKPGYYELWARAVDEGGISQPMVLPTWNSKGYLNNSCHRVSINVSA